MKRNTIRKNGLLVMKHFLIVTLCIATIGLIIPTTVDDGAVYASSDKMTAYTDVVKSGRYAFCEASAKGFYRVDLKNRKVKKIGGKKVVEIYEMKADGKYIYYIGGLLYYSHMNLYRTNKKSGKTKLLAKNVGKFQIKGKKIYYTSLYKDSYGGYEWDDYTDDWYADYMVMKLNGKSKRSTNIVPKVRTKTTNAKGYKTTYKAIPVKGTPQSRIKTWLKIPKGKKIFIAKSEPIS